MKEIVKVLLSEGVDEDTIHEVLDVIEESYEIIYEDIIHQIVKKHGDLVSGDKQNKSDKLIDKVLDAKSAEEDQLKNHLEIYLKQSTPQKS